MQNSSTFLGQKLASPIVTAPCPRAWYAADLIALMQSGAGAVTTKSVTLAPRAGNPEPREYYAEGYAINAVGLANDGLTAHLEYIKEAVAAVPDVPVIISIAGFSATEYATAVRQAEAAAGVWAIELNLSCPNTEATIIAEDLQEVATVLAAVGTCKKPLGIKVNPCTNNAFIHEIVALAAAHGVAFITTTNTLGGALVLDENGNSRLSNGYGGLSGAAIKPAALSTCQRYAQAIAAHGGALELIGLGGVRSGIDVTEYQHVGATAVGLATQLMTEGPECVARILTEMKTR